MLIREDLRPFAGNHLYYVAEAVEFPERRVDVWRDADALKFVVNDGRGEDAVLVEKITPDGGRVHSGDVHVGNGAGLIWIE